MTNCSAQRHDRLHSCRPDHVCGALSANPRRSFRVAAVCVGGGVEMIHATAVVESTEVSSDAVIHPFVVIRPGVRIGRGCTVHPHVVIERDVVIGDDVEIGVGAVVGRMPGGSAALSRLVSSGPPTSISDGVHIGVHAVIYRDVHIGAGTLVADGASIREECRIGERCIVGRYVTINYSVTIGDRVKIMDHAWLAGNMSVGNDVFISGGVLTANDNRIGASGYDAAHVVGPTIADAARIGVGAILLPGVHIGRDATVSAGAVVTRDVADGAMVRGIPARDAGAA